MSVNHRCKRPHVESGHVEGAPSKSFHSRIDGKGYAGVDESLDPATEFKRLLAHASMCYSVLQGTPKFGRVVWKEIHMLALNAYDAAWKFSQSHREQLTQPQGYNLSRWEVGDILYRLGSIAYYMYIRSSDLKYLRHAFMYYERLFMSKYYDNVAQASSKQIAWKYLKAMSMYFLMAFLLDERKTCDKILHSFSADIESLCGIHKDIQRDRLLVSLEEATCIQACIADPQAYLSQFQPLLSARLSTRADRPDFMRAPSSCRLQSAIVVGSNPHQIKLHTMNIDMYRMLLALEYKIETSLSTSNKGKQVRFRNAKDNYPNPDKTPLFHPSVESLLSVFATASAEMNIESDCLLLYISAEGIHISKPSDTSPPKETSGDRNFGICTSNLHRESLQSITSMADSESLLLYSDDIATLCRRHLVLILDSPNATNFRGVHSKFGRYVVALLSSKGFSSADRTDQGSLLTHFLQDPFGATCRILACDTRSNNRAFVEDLLSTVLDMIGEILRGPKAVASTSFLMADPIIARILERFVFCSYVVGHVGDDFATPADGAILSVPSLGDGILRDPLIRDTIDEVCEKLRS